ncbi:MAG: hypothetical protein ACK4VN_12135 [Bacteroidales bacterium]
MQKKLVVFAGLLLVLGVLPTISFAQRGFTEFVTEDHIKVMYRWQRASAVQADSDAVLGLRVTNTHTVPVKWSYSVGFYDGGVLVYQSETFELCLNPGQSRRGSLAGLRFSVEGLTLADTQKESFSWDFGVFDVDEVESCK